MPESFSFNREFDFVRLDGLRRATGRPPHEWDLYIIKELIDNALDADDALWSDDSKKLPCVNIRVEYIKVHERKAHQLFIQVSNCATFPIEQLSNIFSTQSYTSSKAVVKGITRGALGNALKTLLGIPYALRNYVASDWKPELKPLSIICNGTEHLLHYVIDSENQTIRFEYDRKKSKFIKGTIISVGLDHFEQEMPRTLTDIQLLAYQYRLCNPHVKFHWVVEIDSQEWNVEYEANEKWDGKFRGIPPIQWYSATAFQELLEALYRKQSQGKDIYNLPIEIVYQYFADLDIDHTNQSRSSDLKPVYSLIQKEISSSDIKGGIATQLYRLFYQRSPNFNSPRLGAIGVDHVRNVLNDVLTVEGDVIYSTTTDTGYDPNIPFVIEIAIARLKEGNRQLWTAINFTSTYSDPFLSRWLRTSAQPDQLVLGLRGILDTYDLREDTPIIFFLHIICPNIEHHEFSKTEINHLPFKEILGELIDNILKAFRQAREEEELRLEQTVFKTLDCILSELGENERFVFDQLLEKLRSKLSQDPTLAAWVEKSDALGRLQSYITNYQSQNNILSQRVARPATGTLSIPLHPDRHLSILAEHISRDLLIQHNVNKIIYLQVQELEPVIVESGWLCLMDMALLHNPPRRDELRVALMQCIINSDLPILLLHDSDEAGHDIVKEIYTWVEQQQLDSRRIIDLGLDSVTVSENQPKRLVEMMSSELAAWLIDRLNKLAVPIKSLPSDNEIRRDISECFDKLFKAYLWEGLSKQFEITQLIDDLNSELHFIKTMKDLALDQTLKSQLEDEPCTKSYPVILNEVVSNFFGQLMHEQGGVVRESVQAHLAYLQDRQNS